MRHQHNSRLAREMIQDLLKRDREEVIEEYDIQYDPISGHVIDNVTWNTFKSFDAWATHTVNESLGDDDNDDTPSIRSMRRYDD